MMALELREGQDCGDEMKKLLLLVLSPLLLTSALGQQASVNQEVNKGLRYHPGRIMVKFRGTPQFLQGSGQARRLSQQPNLFVVDNPRGISVAEAMGRYKNNPNIVYSEPDYEVQAVDTLPGDPMWSQQWDMLKIQAPQAWNTQTDASDVVVAVIDTGIAFTHPDLQANIWTDAVTGAHGFTCIGSCVAGGIDDYGHGSHVAGTIGAAANNGIGIAGINWGVKLMSLKFLDSSGGGYTSDAVLAFNKIAQLKMSGVNVRVTNNSWGSGGYTQSLKDAMANVESLGILDVCAAGNSGANSDVAPLYPAAFDNRGILSVAASDSTDAGAYFSNVGLATVDIAAPGVSTLSTVPTGPCSLCDPSGYKLLSGTSMATPHVTGVAAALFHVNPAASAAKIRDVILDPGSYDALTDLRLNSTSTSGRLNFAKALNNPSLSTATLNNFPVLSSIPASKTANAGDLITLSASASDPDAGDALKLGWAPLISGSAIYGQMLNNVFPSPPLNANPVSFTASSLARLAFANYAASVADGRGGSATGQTTVEILANPNHGLPPAGVFTLSTDTIPTGGSVNLNFRLTDPENRQPLYWQAWFLSQTVWGEVCCLSASTENFSLQLSYAGVYRVSVQGIDNELNLSPKYDGIVRVGGATGIPPIASTTVDKLDGVAPLTVNIDMRGSQDPDGTISTYRFYCFDTLKSQTNPQASCTYSDPGTYYLWTVAIDNNGYMDANKTYITVLPSLSPPPPPPPPPSPSTVIVIKHVVNNNGATATAANFTMTVTGSSPSPASFAGAESPGTTVTLNAGSYSVSESGPGGYAASFSADCTGSIASGETKTCTVTDDDIQPKLIVINHVINNNGGTATAANFTMTVTGSNPSPASFAGTESPGTTLTLNAGSYSVSETGPSGYVSSLSASCSGSIAVGETRTCTVTNDDVQSSDATPPTVKFVKPLPGETITGQYFVQVSATDNVALSLVELFIDGTRVASSSNGTLSYKWNTNRTQKGPRALTAKATDTSENYSWASPVNVTVK